MTILIVEDNREMRRIMKAIVAGLAHRVEERANGCDALTAYATCRPDWVLIDVRLPGMDGIAAVREIRSRFPDARLLIVTQYDDCGLRQAAQAAGASDYVLKDDLLRLRALLDGAAERNPQRPIKRGDD